MQSGETYGWKIAILEQVLGISLVLEGCLRCEVENDIMTFENLQSVNLSKSNHFEPFYNVTRAVRSYIFFNFLQTFALTPP